MTDSGIPCVISPSTLCVHRTLIVGGSKPVSNTCATHGNTALGSAGVTRTPTAPALRWMRREMGGMEGASGTRIGRTLALASASRKCKFPFKDKIRGLMINDGKTDSYRQSLKEIY